MMIQIERRSNQTSSQPSAQYYNTSPANKSIYKIRKEMKQRQQKKQKIQSTINFLIYQNYNKLLYLESPKDTEEQWLQLAMLSLINEKKISLIQEKNKNKRIDIILKENYEAKQLYQALIDKNKINKQQIQRWKQQCNQNNKDYTEKITQNYSQFLRLEKMYQSSQQQQDDTILQKQKKGKLSTVEKSQIQEESFGNISLLKKRNKSTVSSQFISQLFPQYQKKREATFDEIRKSIKINPDQQGMKLPIILRRYRTLATNDSNIESSCSEALKDSFRERTKTQTNYLNVKTQVLNSTRKKYQIRNIQIGDQTSISPDISCEKQSNNQECYSPIIYPSTSKNSAFNQPFSSERRVNRLSKSAFIEQLRQQLRIGCIKSPSNVSPIKQVKSPKVLDLNPEVFLKRKQVPHRRNEQNMFDSLQNEKYKSKNDKYFKIKKQLSCRKKLLHAQRQKKPSKKINNHLFFPCF